MDNPLAPGSVVRGAARVVGIVAAAIGLYVLLPLESARWWPVALIGLLPLFALVPIIVRRIRRISVSEHPVFDGVEAIVLVVTLLVIGFAALYLTIDRRSDQFVGLGTRLDAVYFTVTTLSTVGFGDISASGQLARLAVTLQILCNFTVVTVAVRALTEAARRRADQLR